MIVYENPFERALSGLQIKDWIWHHSHNDTMFTDLAKRMNSFFNLDNNKYYMLTLCDNVPVAKEVPERGKYYEIPCDSSNGY